MEGIEGVASDPARGRWWYFEVNGYRSSVAAERYLVKPGDRIRWRYLDDPPRRSSASPSRSAKAPVRSAGSSSPMSAPLCPLPARE